MSIINVAACGGSPTSPSGADPRCVALCGPPGENDGEGNWCDADSVSRCFSLCAARIAGQTSLCQTCLLEKAEFSTPSNRVAETCGPTGCEVENGSGERCAYRTDDERRACFARLFPPKEVDCGSPDFRPVTECAAVCAEGAR
jgi:hypothetical protein